VLTKDDITIVALKMGDAYGSEHFNALAKAVRQNTTKGHNLVVWTDSPAGLDCVWVSNPDVGRSKFWPKVACYKPGIVKTPYIMFLDVDILILDNIDDIINFAVEYDFCSYKDPWHSGANVSVFTLKTGSRTELWEYYLKHGDNNHKSDEDMVNDLFSDILYYPKEWIKSYKGDMLGDGAAGAKIVVFHGKPNQWEIKDSGNPKGWVEESYGRYLV
jgi:hypothetical protein